MQDFRTISKEVKSTGQAMFCHLEVTSLDEWRQLVAATKKDYGRLDILVNNAGGVYAAARTMLKKMIAMHGIKNN